MTIFSRAKGSRLAIPPTEPARPRARGAASAMPSAAGSCESSGGKCQAHRPGWLKLAPQQARGSSRTENTPRDPATPFPPHFLAVLCALQCGPYKQSWSLRTTEPRFCGQRSLLREAFEGSGALTAFPWLGYLSASESFHYTPSPPPSLKIVNENTYAKSY